MKISETENTKLFEKLMTLEARSKFADDLIDFNLKNKQPGVRIPAMFITPTVLFIDDKCVESFMTFARSKGCNV
jgi:hypothetical protein